MTNSTTQELLDSRTAGKHPEAAKAFEEKYGRKYWETQQEAVKQLLAIREAVDNGAKLVDGWRSIDSAPKDEAYTGVINCAEWGQPDVWGRPFLCEWDEDDGHVCVHQTEIKPHKPTHWQPLPDAAPCMIRKMIKGE